MSVNEIQALAQKFADAFDRRDIKTVLDILSDDVEVFDTVPYRFDGKPIAADGRTTLVFVKQGTQWKIVSAHFSHMPHTP